MSLLGMECCRWWPCSGLWCRKWQAESLLRPWVLGKSSGSRRICSSCLLWCCFLFPKLRMLLVGSRGQSQGSVLRFEWTSELFQVRFHWLLVDCRLVGKGRCRWIPRMGAGRLLLRWSRWRLCLKSYFRLSHWWTTGWREVQHSMFLRSHQAAGFWKNPVARGLSIRHFRMSTCFRLPLKLWEVGFLRWLFPLQNNK